MSNSISESFKSKLSESNQLKVLEVSAELSINPNWLLAVIYFETAKTFSPSKTNSIGSVGLIQFTRDKAGVAYKTINGVKYVLTDIAKLDFNKQMDLVSEYFKEVKKTTGKSFNSFMDVYFAVFFPKALNQSSSYVLQTSGLTASLIAKQNPIFDTNKDGKITKAEIQDFFKGYFSKNGFDFDTEINQKKALTWVLPLVVFFYSVGIIFL
ncbi:hypothetical protein SAMN05192550_2813 [Flavobacterium glycines]|uniref:EF-hand domain-containing protein n=1 Tax=Flavobacterium glycines TaxID=551990 RepID=A0A1B9DSR3_9FLAO|nr:hypothetical protein [Flavobacterium glycines]OCB72710.1 hypothetical protein FBGL_05140 [Flavobacterium glycines]GEL11812.1 hypothetical protein FGL01_25510 [Flavobacterium glycines]SDJ80829.1 hypothetical protein SAMN05192550_2813 [Flavobacterium glycines]